jgi:hypothetical protein
MAFRRFGTFKTPHGWLGIDGDSRLFQRGAKRQRDDVTNESIDLTKPLQAFLSGGIIRVTAGTIGNKMPEINGVPINDPLAGINPFSVATNGIYQLVATCPASNNGYTTFPSDVPTLSLVLNVPADTDTNAYLSVSTITIGGNQDQVQIQNHLSGSLWAERIKVSDETATYYFNLI